MRNIYILMFLFFLLSCKEKDTSSKRTKKPNKIEKVDFYFPDTIKINSFNKGKLNYDTTVSYKISNVNKRFIFLHLISNGTLKELGLEQIKEMKNKITIPDTLGNGEFKFNIKFDEMGKRYLHGVIEDVLFLKGLKNNKVKIITRKTMITQQVYVKDTI